MKKMMKKKIQAGGAQFKKVPKENTNKAYKRRSSYAPSFKENPYLSRRKGSSGFNKRPPFFKKPVSPFEERKIEHIRLALDSRHQVSEGNGFHLVRLRHCALPEMDFGEVDISTQVFSKYRMKTPFIVSGMTGGWKSSYEMNKMIASQCERRGWMMGTGSQRRQLSDPSSNKEWKQIKKAYPNLRLLGNIGLSQLIGTPLNRVRDLVYSIEATGLVVHCNSLQEALQMEGTPSFKGGIFALKELCEQSDFPIILKETGCGFSQDNLEELKDVKGLYGVDVSGYGGTHWGRIEGARVKDKNHPFFLASQTFKHWGNSTLDSLLWAKEIPQRGYKIWASGGIKNGLDAGKGLCLGANIIGFAKPIMDALVNKKLGQFMERVELELKIALFCMGRKNIKELRSRPPQMDIKN